MFVMDVTISRGVGYTVTQYQLAKIPMYGRLSDRTMNSIKKDSQWRPK